jgi:hypothetical protein
MGYETIHETGISDVFSAIKTTIKKIGSKDRMGKFSSLARAAEGLTLVFPVACTDSITINEASMISKAIERRQVTMLQMLFTAYDIANVPDALAFLRRFHTNLDTKSVDINDVMDVLDTITESSLSYIPTSTIRAIQEDCKRNVNYTFESDINDVSLNEFRDLGKDNRVQVIKEADRPIDKFGNELSDFEMRDYDKNKDAIKQYIDAKNREEDKAEDNAIRVAQNRNQIATQQLLPGDVKKANEMQPSLMLINYYATDGERNMGAVRQAVVGVKAKLYAINSGDIINRILRQNANSDILLKFVKLSTREISVIKDLFLGLDDAKLDAVSKKSKQSNALFNALERRATNGKIRRTLHMNDTAKAITTLVISKEEQEELAKLGVDVSRPNVIVPIMSNLNLLYFIIMDSTNESLMMLTDGSKDFEVFSYSSLERDNGDSSYKKIINLLTKVSQ